MTLSYRRLGTRVQLLLLFGLLLCTGFTVLVLDEIYLRADIAAFQRVKQQSLAGLRLAKSISDAYGLDTVSAVFRVRNNLMGWDQGSEVVAAAQETIRRDWALLLATELPPEQRSVVDEVAAARISADKATQTLQEIFKAQDIGALGRFADTELYPAMDPVASRLKFLVDLKILDTERMVGMHLDKARRISRWRIALSLLTFGVVLLVGRSILRNIYRGVESLKDLAQRARQRDLLAAPAYVPDGELGELHDALLAMRQDLHDYGSELLASEARAKAASRAKSSFLAAMSHEIRTPMVGVAGMLELLAQTPLDADQRQQVEIVQNSAQSLLQIIGDILDFSKIEAGKLEINAAPVDLRELVRVTSNNFLATASAKAIQLECVIDARIAPAHQADAMRLRQILSNFLSNALKFTEHGEVSVELDRLAAEDHRELIALRVRDTGIGISAEDQARLFKPFAQAGEGGALRADSTGLGLDICRQLAVLMGGEIHVESRLGVGTTMSLVLRLPLADPAALERGTRIAGVARAAPSVSVAEREGSLILLVDDHPTNRAVISRQLHQLGYANEVAHDGEAGWQLWRSDRYALLLTDLHMPRRNGHALAEAVRADERDRGRARKPVIAMSANVSTEEVERSRAAGIDDFLAKPTPLALLAATLQRYLPLPDVAIAVATSALALDPDVLKDFLHSVQQDIDDLRSAMKRADTAAVAHEAHRIRGASALVGAQALAECAARIEAAARAGEHAMSAAALEELGGHLRAFTAAHASAARG